MTTISTLISTLLSAMTPRRVRSMREFAEAEIILPEGPRAGFRFKCSFMPWTALAFAAMVAGIYRRFFASGPVQSGKTLIFFVIPILYHLFEREEDVIVGCPKLDTAQGIWEQKILPVLIKTRYAKLIPTKGAGSRGGKFNKIRFLNGKTLRFMGAGGGDDQKSTFTAPVVVLTEVDKMDQPGDASRESDPVTQFEHRTGSYEAAGTNRTYGECTMSHRRGRVNQEVTVRGTDSQVWIECPHCLEYVLPGRDDFTGWQGAENVLVARREARYVCPSCKADWTEADRLKALESPVLATKGQSVNRGGSIEGDPPETDTWGFRWNKMHSRVSNMASIGEAEHLAEVGEDESPRKALYQFTWAIPYEDEALNLPGITKESVLAKIGQESRGMVPTDCQKTILAIDVGTWWCWWGVVGFTADLQGFVVDYGSINTHQDPDHPEPANVLNALRKFRQETILPGWYGPNGKPDMVIVDSGWLPQVVYQFCGESGVQYMAAKGFGTRKNQERWRKPKDAEYLADNWYINKQSNGMRLLHIHSDHWKAQVHDGFLAPPGAPGGLMLYRTEPIDHQGFAKQIVGEIREESFVPNKGTVITWKVKQKKNHDLDVIATACCGANVIGLKPPQPKQEGEPQAGNYKESGSDSSKSGWKIGR